MKPALPLDIAIVTSCHNYGRYLSDWADSILALTERPTMVVIVENGSTDDSPALADRAAEKLRRSGLRVELEHTPRTDFGTARNRAVELAETVWVMHLDADDMLMPHALRDIAELAPHCDIVALGYERCGDLWAGPQQRKKLYQSSAGAGVLSNPTPCSGVSPFRKSFWERKPYDPKLTGGWDTALWLGFGHLGARVRPTKRPCFWYRQHADSVFNTRRLSGWPAARVGAELQSRRRGDHGVSLLVPRTIDGGERDRAWKWLRRRYELLYPDWEIVEGITSAQPWVKGDAVEAALSKCHGTVIVVADADCVVPEEALRKAVARLERGVPWVVPHGQVYRLSSSQSLNWMALEPGEWRAPPEADLAKAPYLGFAGGGIFVAPRAGFGATGGIPRSFLGWGAEDETLAIILDSLLGPHERLGYPLVHLWHPPQPDRRASSEINRRQLLQFRQVARSPEAVWALIQGERGNPVIAGGSLDRAARAAAARGDIGRMFDPFAARRLAALRAPANAMSGTRFTGGKMFHGPRENKMLGNFDNKSNRRFTPEAAELARRHNLSADDFHEVPDHRTVSIGIVRRVLAQRGVA